MRWSLFNTGQRKSGNIPAAMQAAAHTVPATCRNHWTWKRAWSYYHTQCPLVLPDFVDPGFAMEKQRVVDACVVERETFEIAKQKNKFWNILLCQQFRAWIWRYQASCWGVDPSYPVSLGVESNNWIRGIRYLSWPVQVIFLYFRGNPWISQHTLKPSCKPV